MNYNIYEDIAKRTQGDIYVGVVGPVRTGKSTFIKRFMDLMVIPNIDNPHKKQRICHTIFRLLLQFPERYGFAVPVSR